MLTLISNTGIYKSEFLTVFLLLVLIVIQTSLIF